MGDTRPTDVPSVISTIPYELPAGLEFDRYRLLERIGAGGMGIVYRALHIALHRTVAIKVLSPQVSSDPEFAERFQREARVMAQLNGAQSHPNVVQILDYGALPSGQPYLVMEYLEGQTLEQVLWSNRVSQVRMPVEEVLKCIEQVLMGLQVAHAAGVIHRDMKPANVFVGKTIKVLDFGLATGQVISSLGAGGAATETKPMGTVEYVSPEQAQGLAVGPAADLYSVGIMLYEMLSGAVPFPTTPGSTTGDLKRVLQLHLSERPPRLFDVVEGISRSLSEFVEKLLEKSPHARFESADIARAEIRIILSELRDQGTVPGVSLASLQPTQQFPLMSPQPPLPLTQLAAAEPLTSGEIKSVKKPNRALVAGIFLAALAAGGVAVWLSLRTPEVANIPPIVAPPVVESPAHDAGAVVQIPVQPTEELSPLPQFPKPSPPVAKKPPEKFAVSVSSPDCVPDERWKKGALDQVQEYAEQASKKSVKTGVWFESQELAVTEKIRSASTRSDCAALEQQLASLYQELKKR